MHTKGIFEPPLLHCAAITASPEYLLHFFTDFRQFKEYPRKHVQFVGMTVCIFVSTVNGCSRFASRMNPFSQRERLS